MRGEQVVDPTRHQSSIAHDDATVHDGVARRGRAAPEPCLDGVGHGTGEHGAGQRPAIAAAPISGSEASSIFLQIGAFGERGNAEKLSRRVGKYLTRSVRIREANHNGKSLYRVQIGPIANVNSADQIVTALAQIGVTEHHFVGF